MAIFDQRQNLTFGTDLLQMVLGLQRQSMEKERLKMEKEAFKLQQEKAQFERDTQQGTLQQILGMQTPDTAIPTGAANVIANAGQPAGPEVQRVARETATQAMAAADPAQAAVAAKFLGLDEQLPGQLRAQKEREQAKAGLDVMLQNPWLQLAQAAEVAGMPQIGRAMIERYFDANPTIMDKLNRELAVSNVQQNRARSELLAAEVQMLPLKFNLERARVRIAEADVDLRQQQLEFDREMFPLKVEAMQLDNESRSLQIDLDRALNPLRVLGARYDIYKQKYEDEERQFLRDQRNMEMNGETEPQQGLKAVLTGPSVGMEPAQAEQLVRGMTRTSAANVLAEIAIGDARDRRDKFFILAREFGMPHYDAVSDSWKPAAVQNAETFDRLISSLFGEPLPTEEVAFMGTAKLYSLIGGGEQPDDPRVIDAVTADLEATVNNVLTNNGLVGINTITGPERAALRRAIATAGQSNDAIEAYRAVASAFDEDQALRDLKRRFGLFLSATQTQQLLNQQRVAGQAMDRAYDATLGNANRLRQGTGLPPMTQSKTLSDLTGKEQ